MLSFKSELLAVGRERKEAGGSLTLVGEGEKHDTCHNWDYSDNELQMHLFFKEIMKFSSHKVQSKLYTNIHFSQWRQTLRMIWASIEQGEVDYKTT